MALANLAVPSRWYDQWRGFDDFNHPYTTRLLENEDWKPDFF
jgi:hypothetical protein